MYRPLLILIPFSHVCTCVCLPWPRRLGATGLSVPSYLVMQGFLAAIVFGVVEGLWQYMKLMKFLKVSCFLIRTYHFETCMIRSLRIGPLWDTLLGYLEPESRSCLSALEAVVTSYLSDSLDLGRWCPPAHGCETDREVRTTNIYQDLESMYLYIYICVPGQCIQTSMWVSYQKIWVSHFGPGPIDRLFFLDP